MYLSRDFCRRRRQRRTLFLRIQLCLCFSVCIALEEDTRTYCSVSHRSSSSSSRSICYCFRFLYSFMSLLWISHLTWQRLKNHATITTFIRLQTDLFLTKHNFLPLPLFCRTLFYLVGRIFKKSLRITFYVWKNPGSKSDYLVPFVKSTMTV